MIEIFKSHLEDWLPAAGGRFDEHEEWIGFRGTGGTRFDINVRDGIFYILFVKLDVALIGKGQGSELYERLEDIARDLNCHRIQQMPSGWAKTGESRRDYLKRRDWIELAPDGEVYKDLS